MVATYNFGSVYYTDVSSFVFIGLFFITLFVEISKFGICSELTKY